MTWQNRRSGKPVRLSKIKADNTEKFDDKLSGDNNGGFHIVDPTFGKTNVTEINKF